jgi:hypothetical protein
MNRQTVHWEINNAAALVGATVRAVIKTTSTDGFGLKVELPDGAFRNVWVERDPEGNGPGHLAIETLESKQAEADWQLLSRF